MSDFLPLGPEFTESDEVLRVKTLYEDDVKSIAIVALNGTNRATINHRSTTTYEVLAGFGIMHVADSLHILEPGSSVFVPAETPYYDEGRMVMLATSVPPFDIAAVEEIAI
jgi:mannose-6-phosphate isomerase-like protein (cupin superfamily)